MVKKWARVWAVGFVLWTLLAFLNAAGGRIYTVSMGNPESWGSLLAWHLSIAFVWSLLTPPIYSLVRRFPVDSSTWKTAIPLHVVLSIVLSFLAGILVVLAEPYTMGASEPRAPFMAHAVTRLLMDVQRYWYILLITQAISFYQRYRERELLSSRLEAQLAHAQLEVLKIQLEPHFLFNTLNSIATLARNDGAAAEHMTLQLADLLRCSLDAVGVHEVPLSRELTFLQKYIDIQQTRFRDRLRVELEIDPHSLSALVPNFILQPLVENAIRHGIGPRRTPGWVRITTRRDGETLWMEIRDDGVGLRREGGHISEGVGLRNTRARLRQLYNDEHYLVLANAPEGGCRVQMRIPYRKLEEEVVTADEHTSVA